MTALARLDPEDRALLALRHVAGLSMSEVGQALRRSKPPVEIRLARIDETSAGSCQPAPTRPSSIACLGSASAPTPMSPSATVDADATARRARAEESLERTRVVSVAIAAVVGVFVAMHPHLARTVLRTLGPEAGPAQIAVNV